MPTILTLKTELNEIIDKLLNDKLKIVLSEIASEYKLDLDELETKYLRPIDIILIPEIAIMTEPGISENNNCKAKTASGKQCSRKMKKDNMYCGSHIEKRPNGDYEHE